MDLAARLVILRGQLMTSLELVLEDTVVPGAFPGGVIIAQEVPERTAAPHLANRPQDECALPPRTRKEETYLPPNA